MGTETLNVGDATIDGDLACCRCGYNLRTIAADALCPECGQPVELSVCYQQARRGRWHLHAGSEYARWMRRLSHAILLALMASLLSVFVPFHRAIELTDVAAAAVVWVLSCWALWSAASRPGLAPAGGAATAPLRVLMRLSAVLALGLPAALEISDRVAPWEALAPYGRVAARLLGGAAGVGSVAFLLYVAVVAWQSFRAVTAGFALLFAATAAVVLSACATDHRPFRTATDAVEFTWAFGRHYIPVVGPTAGAWRASEAGHVIVYLAAVVLLWSLPFLLWTAFSFAWTARQYELREMDLALHRAGRVRARVAAPGGRS